MKPNISVIVPVYNVEKYLKGCLDNLLAQTLQDIEIVIVDDCGSDKSMQIAAEYAARDPRIKIIRHDQNVGRSAARNTGIQNSTAPLIMFCDSDDKFAPDMCAKMHDAMADKKTDLAVCGITVEYQDDTDGIKESDDDYYAIKYTGLHPVSDDVKRKTDMSVCNKIFRRDFLEKYNIAFPHGLNFEDAYFVNAYLFLAKNIFFLPEKLYVYLRHGGSIMTDTFAHKSGVSIQHLQIAIALYDFLMDQNLDTVNQDYMLQTFFDFLSFALNYEPTDQGKKEIYDLAINFANQNNWSVQNMPLHMRRKYQMMINRTLLGETRKKLGGLIKIKEYSDKTKISFLGLPIWRIRYRGAQTEYGLFGIKIFVSRPHVKKIKKGIGILNFSNFEDVNFGAVLTGYALNKFLRDQGYNAFNINYAAKFYTRQNLPKSIKFAQFRESYLPMTHAVESQEDFYNLNRMFKTFIVGSDQVFNHSFVCREKGAYYLSFVKNRKKKIAYAASFGQDHYTGDPASIPALKKCLSRFNALSTREESGIQILKNTFDLSSRLVLDPVFLLNDYSEIMGDYVPAKPTYYVLNFKMAEIAASGLTEYENLYMTDFSIQDWLAAIKNAPLFVTDSFHGMCFALMFGVPFVALAHRESPFSRIENLFDMFDIPRNKILFNDTANIDWSNLEQYAVHKTGISDHLRDLQKKSADYLLNAIKG